MFVATGTKDARNTKAGTGHRYPLIVYARAADITISESVFMIAYDSLPESAYLPI